MKQSRSVRLYEEQIRALIAAAHYSRDHNVDLSEDECAALDMAREPLAEALRIIEHKRS